MKIISGGQTGADQGALEGAKSLGLETGGWMPRNFRTEAGTRPDMRKLYNMREYAAFAYETRTTLNIIESNGTLVIGDIGSPGTKLTLRLCGINKKPYTIIMWTQSSDDETWLPLGAKYIRNWISLNNISILNVAGNRESVNPGIQNATKKLIIKTFGELNP